VAPPPNFLSAALRTQVKFWQKIFGVYSKHQIVFHDPENLARVYSVLDFRDRAAAGESELVLEIIQRDAVAKERERIRGVLLRLDARQGNSGGLDDEERKVWDLFGNDKDLRRFAAAADPSASGRSAGCASASEVSHLASLPRRDGGGLPP
jgi:hypothetical protein